MYSKGVDDGEKQIKKGNIKVEKNGFHLDDGGSDSSHACDGYLCIDNQ